MSEILFWAIVAVCAEVVALAILVLVISLFNRSRKKVIIAKKQHCPRCHRDNVKLYPWKAFNFCLVCVTELKKRKSKKK
jgi:hypothetical protein